MLDEECLLPHGTDSGFVALLQSQTQVIVLAYVYVCNGTVVSPNNIVLAYFRPFLESRLAVVYGVQCAVRLPVNSDNAPIRGLA